MIAWRNLCLLLLPTVVVVQGGLDNCGDFSVDRCQPSEDTIVGLQHLPCQNLPLSTCAAICQQICAVEAACTFFSYNAANETCVLLRELEHNGYYAECGLLAGPPEPSMLECDQQLPVDDCRRFVFEDCDYKGTEVYAERDVTNAADCQRLLAQIGGYYNAQLFLHDAHQFNLCSFLTSRERECQAVSGPVHPSFEECFAGPTSTSGPPTTTGYGLVSVRFVARDATTNQPLSRVMIGFPDYASILTDDQGQAHMLLAGVEFPYSLDFSAAKAGYETYNSTVSIMNNAPVQIVAFSLSPTLTPDQNYRLVMTWGPQPSDLDLHVIEFDDNYVCETYYSNKNGCFGLSLDVDNTQGGNNGAETITWGDSQAHRYKRMATTTRAPTTTPRAPTTTPRAPTTSTRAPTTTPRAPTTTTTRAPATTTTPRPQQPYTYLMFVYRYAGSPDLVDSQAELRLYDGNGTVLHYSVPTSDPNTTDRYWVLGCFDGRVGLDSLQVINVLVKDKPATSLCN